MDAMNELEKLQEVARDLGLSLRGYSGRGMCGEECPAISGDDGIGIVEAAAGEGVRGARMDSLGLGTVVYWPRLKWDRAFALEGEGDD